MMEVCGPTTPVKILSLIQICSTPGGKEQNRWVDVLPEVNIHIEKILFLKGTIQSKFDSLLILGVIVAAREQPSIIMQAHNKALQHQACGKLSNNLFECASSVGAWNMLVQWECAISRGCRYDFLSYRKTLQVNCKS